MGGPWIVHRAGTVLLLGLLALPACSAITSEDPPLTDSTMVDLLIELHLADARLDLQYDRTPAIRDSILYKYGLDEERFRHVLTYYADHPEAYAAIYSTVLDRISDERLRQGSALPLDTPPPPGAQ